jgi:hypothetical protein
VPRCCLAAGFWGRMAMEVRMAYREIVSEAKRLPLHQQLQLVEEILVFSPADVLA